MAFSLNIVQFYKVEPKDKVGIITVQCTKIAKCTTQIEVSYEYIGLSEKGNEFVEGFTSTEYKANSLINAIGITCSVDFHFIYNECIIT